MLEDEHVTAVCTPSSGRFGQVVRCVLTPTPVSLLFKDCSVFEPPALFLFLVLSNRQRERSCLSLWHHLHNGSWHGCFWTWVTETCKNTSIFKNMWIVIILDIFLKMEHNVKLVRCKVELSVILMLHEPLQAASPPRATTCLCHPKMIGQRPSAMRPKWAKTTPPDSSAAACSREEITGNQCAPSELTMLNRLLSIVNVRAVIFEPDEDSKPDCLFLIHVLDFSLKPFLVFQPFPSVSQLPAHEYYLYAKR